MRILLVGAGASFSTRDVEDGYLDALRACDGVEVYHYDLEARLGLAREWLHTLWRRRGKIPEQRPSWPDTIYRGSIEAFEMALRYDVDWVVVVSGMYFHPDVLELMRRARLRTAVLFTESPYEDDKQARVAANVDMCWTTERTSAARLGARYVRHAYDPQRHQPGKLDVELPTHDVVFVGTGFAERIELLERVNWEGIDLGLYGEWALLGSRHKLRKFIRGGFVDNATTAALYRGARIGLNLYRSSQTYGRHQPRVPGESLNPRAYELAACQVFSLSDWRPEVEDTFGEAVPTFTTAPELEDLVRSYLNNSPERRRLARLARQRILPHTFAARAAQVLADLDAVDDRAMLKGA